MSYNSPSIGDLLVATLCSAKSTRRFYAIIREREFKRYKKESIQVALSRLHKRGYVNNSAIGWSVTKKGKEKINNTRPLDYIPSPFGENSPINNIISFDIPGPKRTLRDWLRNQIKIFGYKMLQQSLWLGPGPLPPEFLKRLEELKIGKNIKIFSVQKKQI
jgi:DNA-binding transcriptional regulator PaaX